MKLVTSALFALFAAGFVTPALAAQPLLTPTELAAIANHNNVRIIDIRPTERYDKDHISGAVSAPYPEWRGPADNPGKLPPLDQLTDLVRSLGLTADTHAVVVGIGNKPSNFGGAARVYWTLKYLGFTQLSILNGGHRAWRSADLPVDLNPPKITPSHYQVQLNRSIIATTKDVAAQVDNPKTLLVDARPHSFYVGDKKAPTAAVAGTIKGAVNIEQGKWFKPGTAIFVSTQDAQQIAGTTLTDPAQETISFCNTGHWASTDWFALSEIAGVKNVKLYPQSLAAWTQNSSLPMQNVPSRGQQILRKIKGIFN